MGKQVCNIKKIFWSILLIYLGTSRTGLAQKVYGYKSTLTEDEIKYAVYFPEGYNINKKYPLLLFLHGMDEKTWPAGGFNPKVKMTGLPLMLEKGLKLPFVVVVPCCAYSDWDNIGYNLLQQSKMYAPGALPVEIARIAIGKYSIDTTRLYITGLSMGGGGVFSVIQNFPDFFHAAIPIAGWGDPGKACKTQAAVWAFQGEKDESEGIRNLIAAIKKCNTTPEAKVTILLKQGHVIWDKVYENKASGNISIYDWLLKFSAQKKL